MARRLFDEDSSGSEPEFSVSNKYAESYNRWREKEEYQKLQAKYGKEVAIETGGGDGESSSSSEDEDAEEITPQVEKQFFEALSKLKQNDPEIYDPGKKFFKEKEEKEQKQNVKNKEKSKPMFLRDYEREMLLKSGEVQDESDEPGPSGGASGKTYMEEQEEIKAGFRTLLEDSDDEEQAGFGSSLLQKRAKSDTEKAQEDEEYKEWLKGQKDSVEDRSVAGRLGGLRDAWANPKITKDEAFLRDYILNKRYLEEGDDSYVPSYEEVVHDSEGDLSEDERTLGHQEQFEHKFNFRFEEPDQEFIKRYPRTIKNSLRKKDERRKQTREEKRKRQEEEKKKKEEEVKRLKALKKKEIMEKLQQLKEAVGNEDLPFEANDLDADFDPDAHDKKMQSMFSDDYYYADGDDEEKPVFSDDGEDWDSWQPGEEEEEEADQAEAGWEEQAAGSAPPDDSTPACEQPGFVMDCDYNSAPRHAPELVTGRQKKKKRRGKLAELLKRKKPRFDPAGAQPLAEYVEQYYKLDEMLNPAPFRYREVVPNDFGLDTTEILMADERDLNRWVSVKRMSQYRRDEDERLDVKKYKAKASNPVFKQKILQSLYTKEDEVEDPENYEPQKKKKKKRKKKEKETAEDTGDHHQEEEQSFFGGNFDADSQPEPEAEPSEATESQPKKKKKRKRKENGTTEELEVEQRLQGDPGDTNGHASHEGSEERKKKKKKKHREMQDDGASELAAQATDLPQPESEPTPKKRKKKRKHQGEEAPADSSQRDPAEPGPAGKKRRGGSTDQAETAKRPSGDRVQKKSGGKRRARPEKGSQAAMVLSMSDARLEAFGLNPKKFKSKMIYGKTAS